MADKSYQREIQRVARTVLSGVRASLEEPYAAHYRQKSENAPIIKEILLAVESARISFVASGRGDREPAENLKLAHAIRMVMRHPVYTNVLRNVRFRMNTSGDLNVKPSERFYGRFMGQLRVGEALSKLVDLLLEDADQSELPIDGVSELRSIIPDQKIAPLQFEISNNKLVISNRESQSRAADGRNIEAAKAELRRNGERIISELKQSNCDKRLLASLQELQAQLQNEIDAIKVGLMNIGCEMMCSSFEAELPTAVASMLRAHTRGVQMFVGQFPEWTKFVENAAAADLDKTDMTELRAASTKVVDELNAHPDLVNSEVPRTLAFLSEMLDNPTQSGKRAAFAVLRSLENLVSRVFGYGAEFAEKTVRKTIDGASTAASKIVIGMLLLGLTSAIAIGPISGKIPDMNWLKTATEIVKKQLHEMTGQ